MRALFFLYNLNGGKAVKFNRYSRKDVITYGLSEACGQTLDFLLTGNYDIAIQLLRLRHTTVFEHSNIGSFLSNVIEWY